MVEPNTVQAACTVVPAILPAVPDIQYDAANTVSWSSFSLAPQSEQPHGHWQDHLVTFGYMSEPQISLALRLLHQLFPSLARDKFYDIDCLLRHPAAFLLP
eukprot:6484377-Pyramimonas_sp.AAC.1